VRATRLPGHALAGGPQREGFVGTQALEVALPQRADGGQLGLCDYWVKSGQWPDCAKEGVLPYDFKAECRKLAAA
jgi:hypothetical protein